MAETPEKPASSTKSANRVVFTIETFPTSLDEDTFWRLLDELGAELLESPGSNGATRKTAREVHQITLPESMNGGSNEILDPTGKNELMQEWIEAARAVKLDWGVKFHHPTSFAQRYVDFPNFDLREPEHSREALEWCIGAMNAPLVAEYFNVTPEELCGGGYKQKSLVLEGCQLILDNLVVRGAQVVKIPMRIVPKLVEIQRTLDKRTRRYEVQLEDPRTALYDGDFRRAALALHRRLDLQGFLKVNRIPKFETALLDVSTEEGVRNIMIWADKNPIAFNVWFIHPAEMDSCIKNAESGIDTDRPLRAWLEAAVAIAADEEFSISGTPNDVTLEHLRQATATINLDFKDILSATPTHPEILFSQDF